MKIDRILNSKILNNRIFAFAVCAVFVVLSSIYYYGLQCEYPPQSENIVTITSMYSHLTLGTENYIKEIACFICAFLATKIGGMTYFATRLNFTFLYGILLCFIVFLCLRSKKEYRTNLYRLPLVALFSVIMYPVADNPELFQYIKGADFIYEWPFHYHYSSRIYALVCLALLLLLLQCRGKTKKIVYGVLLAVVCLYAAKKTDLVFYTMFAAPTAIVLLLCSLQNDKLRKYAVYWVSGGMGLLFLSRIMPIGIKTSLWAKERASVYGAIYGGTNWISIDAIGEQLINYIGLNCMLFNIQLPESPLISLYTVVYVLKLTILIVGYLIMFHIIKCSFVGKSRLYHYDYIDQILAWGYVLLSCVFIFTEHGSMTYGKYRYFSALTAAMTVLICRNIEVVPQVVGLEMLKEIKYKKVLLCAYAAVICFCTMGKVWAYRAPNGYDPELEAIVDYIEGTGYGYAVAGYWLWPRLTAISGGEVMVYETEDQVKDIYGDDAKVAYIITRNDGYSDGYGPWDDYEEMREYYSEPTDVIRYERLQLVIYKDGVKIKE